MKTFPTSTENERTDLKRLLQRAIVQWLTEHKMASGSLAGRLSIYDAVDEAVDAEFEKVRLQSECVWPEGHDFTGPKGGHKQCTGCRMFTINLPLSDPRSTAALQSDP